MVRVAADRRPALIEHLTNKGIASAVYYPVPLHLQPALQSFGYRKGMFPHAERAARETLALPIYPELADVVVGRVSEAIAEFFSQRHAR